MSLYRCAACGSPNVVTDIENGGVNYNYVKGAVGTVLLGPGGAAAGIQSKKEQVYKCPDCGLTLKEPMGFEIKTLIDIGVMSVEARKKLELNGMRIDWEVLTNKYKNIEKSDADKQTAGVQVSNSAAVHVVEDSVVAEEAEGSSEYKKLYEEARAQYEEECEKWRIEVEKIEETRRSKMEEEINTEYLRQKDALIKEMEQTIQAHKNMSKQYAEQKVQAEAKYQTLGALKFSEKKKVKAEIERLTQAIQAETVAQNATKINYDKKLNTLDKERGKLRETIIGKLNNKYPFPPKPSQPVAMRKYTAAGTETSAKDYAAYYMQDEIFRFVEKQGEATFSTIRKGCGTFSELSDQFVKGLIKGLIDSNELREVNGKYFVRHGISKAKAEAEQAEKVKSVLGSPEKRMIYEMLQKSPDEKFTITQVLNATNLPADCTHMRVSSCLRQLVAAGLVERTEDSKSAYFKLAK